MERGPVDATALRAALGARWPRTEVVAETESTNTALAGDPAAPDRAVLVAEHQRSGRGRLERSWSSPPRAGLTFSVALRPRAPIRTWSWLPLLTGVAVHDALAVTTGVPVRLKWPNDVLHGPSERKLAGILAQSSGEAVVIGIGLNVSTTEPELPVDTATSLALCGASEVDRTALLAEILTRLDRRVAQWDDVAGDAAACGLAADYRAACATLGRTVVVTMTDGHSYSGRAVGIDAEGRLQVHRDGRVEAVGAGDVEHLRRSGR
jgi:BirA family biotin operon repressor/biotin-[acetyl-CoA-carboxylase] ligase